MDPKRTRLIAVIVVVVVVAAGVGGYFYYVSTAGSCNLKSTNPLIMNQAEMPDTLDPAVTFNTPGWAAIYESYQPLIMYNGSSYTTFNPDLASSWSASSDGFHYNFTIQSGAKFSNGDPVNAYTFWFSMYRTILMQQASSFILTQNFWTPGASYGDSSNFSALASDLNTWNFQSPNAAAIAAMQAPNQSFRALSASLFQVNLGFGYLGSVPYTYILPTLVAPVAVAVDPTVVQQNGGVVVGSPNSWMAQHMLGSGPYTYGGSYSTTSTQMTFQPDSNYWGASVASTQPWNNGIQPALTAVETDFQSDTSIDIQNLKTGGAASVSFVYSGTQSIQSLTGQACVSVTQLPVVYGATAGSWYIYMNQSQAPFNNWSVRGAVAHAVDYNQIIQEAFGGYGTQWVGPVPPSYPDYNPSNLTPYQFNLAQAMAMMNNSPWPCHASSAGPCGTSYGPTLYYEYINTPVWQDVATLLKADLAQIGITIQPVSVALNNLYQLQAIDSTTGQCTAQERSQFGGPFPIGQEFYTSDYISPDDWTQNVAISYGSANQCMAGYANATVDNLVISAAGEHNAATATADYTTMTQYMYNNYTDVWLVVPTAISATNIHLQGAINNPMGSALPFVMLYNSEHSG